MKTKKSIKVKDYKHACKLLKLDPAHSSIFYTLPEKYRAAAEAHYELMIITEAANNSVPANYTDGSWKYEPRFWIEANEEHPTGVGFSHSDCDNWYAHTLVGSRLSSRSEETCMDLAKRFEPHYKNLLLEPTK